MDKRKKYLFLYIILSLGIILSGLLVYEHLAPKGKGVCRFDGNLDCGVVNKSPYANLDGIFYFLVIDKGFDISLIDLKGDSLFLDLLTSNAFLGIVMFLLLMIMLRFKQKKWDFLFIDKKDLGGWIRGLLVFSLVYGLYLLYIQHFILKTYCVFCISLDLIIILSLAFSWKLE